MVGRAPVASQFLHQKLWLRKQNEGSSRLWKIFHELGEQPILHQHFTHRQICSFKIPKGARRRNFRSGNWKID